MAELGHPTIGPQSFWKLTPAEVRIYAEGLQERAEKKQEAQTHGGDPSYNRDAKRQRDHAALQRVHEKATEQQ